LRLRRKRSDGEAIQNGAVALRPIRAGTDKFKGT
jgi:hypothetical protein